VIFSSTASFLDQEIPAQTAQECRGSQQFCALTRTDISEELIYFQWSYHRDVLAHHVILCAGVGFPELEWINLTFYARPSVGILSRQIGKFWSDIVKCQAFEMRYIDDAALLQFYLSSVFRFFPMRVDYRVKKVMINL
jgi:hypothetical protein